MSNFQLERIRNAVRDGRVRFSEHAFEELLADQLDPVDAESALLTGRLARTEKSSPQQPGPRYTVIGNATDLSTEVGVVCRFTLDESLLIVTAYETLK